MKIISRGLFRSIREFKLLDKKLGSGSFGVVRLAVHRPTGKLYAIKVVTRQPRRSTSPTCPPRPSSSSSSGKSASTRS